jgi:hypothetical protein
VEGKKPAEVNEAAIIFSHSITPRVRYVVDFLSNYYGLGFKLTSDEGRYLSSPVGCKINYSFHPVTEKEIWIHPHALLFESAVHPVKVECFKLENRTVFFKAEGNVGFDLFAALFYLITRYEEYLPHQKDAYGRYGHQNSLAFKEGFLHLPLVNLWLEDFRTRLTACNEAFSLPARGFSFEPTYDIDMAWSFRNKGFGRNAGGLARLLITGRWRAFSQRISVLRKKRTDPFDAYGWMDSLHAAYGLHPTYFFLVAHQKGQYDKNIPVENSEFRELVRGLAHHYPIALHPSWASGDHPELVGKEKKWLEDVLQKPVTASRQHYIRFSLPATYRQLIAAGIQHDYSMGYGTINGFRASIATPYSWFDLKSDEATALQIHPFCFMDANAFYEQGLSPQEALEASLRYLQAVKEVNGTLITIWHNSFLGTSPQFEGWKEVYREFVRNV